MASALGAGFVEHYRTARNNGCALLERGSCSPIGLGLKKARWALPVLGRVYLQLRVFRMHRRGHRCQPWSTRNG